MATSEKGQTAQTFRRQLLIVQFSTYRRIVERKHGLAVPVDSNEVENLSDEDLSAYVDSLRDLAHLPPQ
jgi:hypothetical protein